MASIPLTKLSEINTIPINWLLEPFLAFGKLSLLLGDPGIGKTYLAIAIASHLSNGKSIDGSNIQNPVKVMYQSAEDNYQDTIKPRFEKLMANMDYVYFVDENHNKISANSFELEETIKSNNINFLIFDTLQAYIGEIDMNRANEVRGLTARLKGIAERTNCAIMLLSHFNKADKGKGVYRGLGSIDFMDSARSVLSVERNPNEEESIRIVKQIKNNMAPDLVGFRYRLDDSFEFLDWITSVKEKDSKKKIAERVLIDMLSQGDYPSTEIYDAINETYNISLRTIKTAVEKSNCIKSIKKGTRWYLHLDPCKNDVEKTFKGDWHEKKS